MRRRNSNMRDKPGMENYLREGALLSAVPSGTHHTGGVGANP